MLFKKLFRLLVVSGSLMGAASGCAARAAEAQAPKKDAPDAGAAPDAHGAARAREGLVLAGVRSDNLYR